MVIEDINYFLEEERKFKESHVEYGEFFFDESINEMSCIGNNDPLCFLSENTFEKYSKNLVPIYNDIEYGLTKAQILMLRLFLGDKSYLFRYDYYYGVIPEIVKNMIDTLNSVIEIAPITKENILYRYCKKHDNTDINIGEIIKIEHHLTCTNYEWHQEKDADVYEIHTLNDGKTKARDLYKIHPHADENQVNFLRNTKFMVTDIYHKNGSENKWIVLQEIE